MPLKDDWINGDTFAATDANAVATQVNTNTTGIAGKQTSNANLTTLAGLTATTDNVIQSVAGAWASRTMAQLKTALALVKGDVGLGNVDNTSNATERAAAVTLTNHTLDNTNTLTVKDANLTIQDDGDITKQAKFQASGISAGQTRTFTLPDASTTLVGNDTAQALTVKTLALGSNTVTGSVSDFNTALTGADFYTSGGTDVPITDGGTGVSTLPSGLLKGAGTGAITAATAGTDYYAPGSTDVAVADGGTGASTLTGVLKGNGASAFTAAAAGTDYVAPGGALGTPSSGTLTNCTGLPVAGGGTGAATLTGLVKGNGTSAFTAAAAGTDYLTPSGSAASLTSFPTFNQNTTGSAATLSTPRTINGVSFNGSANIVVVPRVGTTASSATPSIDAALYEQYNITALAAAITAVTVTNPAEGLKLTIRIKDNGTARAIALGASFRALGVTLPTTTVLSKTLYIGCIYNGADTIWDVVATAQQA